MSDLRDRVEKYGRDIMRNVRSVGVCTSDGTRIPSTAMSWPIDTRGAVFDVPPPYEGDVWLAYYDADERLVLKAKISAEVAHTSAAPVPWKPPQIDAAEVAFYRGGKQIARQFVVAPSAPTDE